MANQNQRERQRRGLVNLEDYERSPFLTPAEQAEIDCLTQRWQRKVFTGQEAFIHLPEGYVLSRLLAPIYQVGQLTGVSHKTQAVTARLLILEMHQRQNTYWAWDQKDWNSILKPNVQAFRDAYCCYHYTRVLLLMVSYLLGNCVDIVQLNNCLTVSLAERVFGRLPVGQSIRQLTTTLTDWGYASRQVAKKVPKALCLLLLVNRSPRLEDLSIEQLEALRRQVASKEVIRHLYRISLALHQLGFIHSNLQVSNRSIAIHKHERKTSDIASDWVYWCDRWASISTRTYRRQMRRLLLKIGRYLTVHHPRMAFPGNWTRDTALEVVAAVSRMRVGEWNCPDYGYSHLTRRKLGNPLSAASRDRLLGALRCFFRDGQEWEWFPRRFDPFRALATPFSVLALTGPAPRTIADDIWAKLLYAGLHLSVSDLPATGASRGEKSEVFYPLEMVKAVAVVWLFTGLRCDEICRLRVECIRWQRETTITASDEKLSAEAVCWLDVPVHKTGAAFTKPVDRLVGEAVTGWQQARPLQQPTFVDRKTGERVQLLFSLRGKALGHNYINKTLIPLLCHKAGVPREDARGNITSHRARSTIASQLFNAREPLSLFDLQEWLGHRFITSTQHYARLTPTKVAKAYQKAGYFERNVRTIEVLIDQDVIKTGAAARGEPWKYYDLGHGYCTYDFFDQCPHRMACARCSFYRPKNSSLPQLLEGKANLQRMLQEIPLGEDERKAVEEGIEAMNELCLQLANVPTPAGLTPNQLREADKQ